MPASSRVALPEEELLAASQVGHCRAMQQHLRLLNRTCWTR